MQYNGDATYFLEERYAKTRADRHGLTVFYALKPLMPRRVQRGLRRAYARRRKGTAFPHWPIEPMLVEREQNAFLSKLRESSGTPVAFVNYWPDAHRFCSVITHDVESELGMRNIDRILEVERAHGFRSAWYFVGDDYPIPEETFAMLREGGNEIGLHGVHHDGKLFQSREHFEASLPEIHRYMQEWQAEGFRSPALHRSADWMPELRARYDSSFPDTDPFDPQPGGCCSIFPYFLGDLVELPLTMVHDYTLFEILCEKSPRRWIEKASWIGEHHGMVNLLTHPDYVTDERLVAYDEFLGWLARQEGQWKALPRDVAQWWRERQRLVEEDDAVEAVRDRPDLPARVAYAREEEGRVVIEV